MPPSSHCLRRFMLRQSGGGQVFVCLIHRLPLILIFSELSCFKVWILKQFLKQCAILPLLLLEHHFWYEYWRLDRFNSNTRTRLNIYLAIMDKIIRSKIYGTVNHPQEIGWMQINKLYPVVLHPVCWSEQYFQSSGFYLFSDILLSYCSFDLFFPFYSGLLRLPLALTSGECPPDCGTQEHHMKLGIRRRWAGPVAWGGHLPAGGT